MLGTTVSHYRILEKLGGGGMGVVYKAEDTRLQRFVALKFLPESVAKDSQALERFQREAKIISSLNHPNICTLHDIGQQEGLDYLVFEYLEGETLAERLEKGPLPYEYVLRYGIEIGDALDKAHRQSVIHRDLKPSNIMLTKSGAKLLDFGVAKALPRAAGMRAAIGATSAPTASKPLTAEGTIVGTFQYMSPEQVEGKEADARSDIFAFGAMLYEMATGKKAFEGKTTASVIAAVLEREPSPISTLRPLIPPALDRVVKKCLAKAPDERWQSAKDLHDELKWILEGGSQVGVPLPVTTQRKTRQRFAWVGAAGVTIVALGLLVFAANRVLQPEAKGLIRFVISPPENASFPSEPHVSLSPDGRRLVFVAHTSGGNDLLYLRPLDSVTAQVLPGTEGAGLPFWSPDGRYLSFFADDKLKKIDVAGGSGPPVTLCDAPNWHGGTWNRDGVIVFSADLSGGVDLYRVPDSGGVPVPLALERSLAESGQIQITPQFLPDGRHFLYFSASLQSEQSWICVGSLDSKETKRLVHVNSQGMYAPPGYLLFVRQGTLLAQAFDPGHVQLKGDPSSIAEGVASSALIGEGHFSTSESGVLAYENGRDADTQLVRFDRTGTRHGTVGGFGAYTSPAISPDGSKLAVGVRDPHTQTRDIWIFDLKRGTGSRLTFDPADDLSPVWSADGGRILFTSTRRGHRDIYLKSANGIGDEQLVFESNGPKSVDDWSSDGRYIVYDFNNTSRSELWVLPLFGERKPFPFVQTKFGAAQAQLSPNTCFVAYLSSESGGPEVYVQTFPEQRGKWRISTSGGTQPQWRRDGKELFYLADGKMMAVDIKTDSRQLELGIPRILFDWHLSESWTRNDYVVTPDGRQFLAVIPVAKSTPDSMTVVVNWTAGLK
jgi:eukaryotic-like serine/threonine-protein kinase